MNREKIVNKLKITITEVQRFGRIRVKNRSDDIIKIFNI